MNQLLTFIRKEFLHVLRDRKTLLILFGLPVVQIMIFGFALTNEVKNATIVVMDEAHDVASRQIIDRIAASSYFRIERTIPKHGDIDAAFRQGRIKLAVVFPAGFNDDLVHLNKAGIQIIADASEPNTATTLTNYLTSIVMDYQTQMIQSTALPYRITTEVRMLYNPQLKGAPNFVPGVMALVLMLVCVMMTSISIVREKELGTMEILLVSPFRPFLVIVAKVVPYLILSLVNVTTIILLSIFVLGLPVNGSIVLLFLESTLFIVTSLSLGLLISTLTDTQQTAMLFSMMGMLLPTVLFSGFMFPIENMPLPLQIISNAVPAKWYYIIVKSVMIKGTGLASIWRETLVLTGMTLVLTIISLRKFKVRLA
ncbi:MAG: ABC transporter permease ['Candidatus Kapabacteria' thiocyanatum]|uniref:Multidrug ABC transporter permease n=1 Tax=Candidatus Kapaibacterium thiocyanatum TaxID=1895771 RepID=A0A1M3L688_9BACT|nr:ABC transporter permease ['Candidatus Kapabacteria' thiocyanatum]OJX61075.1 MAG: multidrug ABC transporter permease ['Candidatus Kapabacteria' thiocyanatum]